MKRPTTTKSTAGIAVILLGIAALAVGDRLDGGFLGGMFQGAGLALVLFGVFIVGSQLRPRRSDDDTWLPSRDGDA